MSRHWAQGLRVKFVHRDRKVPLNTVSQQEHVQCSLLTFTVKSLQNLSKTSMWMAGMKTGTSSAMHCDFLDTANAVVDTIIIRDDDRLAFACHLIRLPNFNNCVTTCVSFFHQGAIYSNNRVAYARKQNCNQRSHVRDNSYQIM